MINALRANSLFGEGTLAVHTLPLLLLPFIVLEANDLGAEAFGTEHAGALRMNLAQYCQHVAKSEVRELLTQAVLALLLGLDDGTHVRLQGLGRLRHGTLQVDPNVGLNVGVSEHHLDLSLASQLVNDAFDDLHRDRLPTVLLERHVGE